jgi:REP element-mobilizing transposase RayT
MTGPTSLQPDMYYHIFNRGINGENIFREERNYQYFLDLYAKHIDPIAETFAYSLLKNHFHLLVKVRSDSEMLAYAQSEILDENQTLRVSKTLRVLKHDPSMAFANFFNAYAKGFNKTYGRTGSLFEHPFHRVMVTDDAQFTVTVRYIHQNPQKHGFVDDFRAWPYSSYGSLISDRVTRLNRDAVQAWFGGSDGLARDHTVFVNDHKFGDSMEFI